MFKKSLSGILNNLSLKSFKQCQKYSSNVSSSFSTAIQKSPSPLQLSFNKWKSGSHLFYLLRYCSQTQMLPTENQIAIAKLEYESCKLDGVLEIPSQLSELQWEELAIKESTMQRRKYLRFLFLSEMKRINDKKKNAIVREYSDKKREIALNEKEEYIKGNRHIIYGLWNNTYSLKINDVTMKKYYNYNAMMAFTRGIPIVFDAGFTSMNSAEETRASEQFSNAVSINRMGPDPFHVYMCNYPYNSSLDKRLVRTVPTIHNTDFPLDVHAESYLDLFPRNNLVYLTPHCTTDLKEFDDEAVYIIGYLVDTRDSEPLSLAKAKRENIKMRRLPLDKYLNWGTGQKSLTLNQMMGILVELKNTGSWVKAFEKHIPTRKLQKRELTPMMLKDKMAKEQSRKLYSRVNMKSLFQE